MQPAGWKVKTSVLFRLKLEGGAMENGCDGWGKDPAVLVSCFRPGSAVEGPRVFTEAFQPRPRKADESFFPLNLTSAEQGWE